MLSEGDEWHSLSSKVYSTFNSCLAPPSVDRYYLPARFGTSSESLYLYFTTTEGIGI